MRWVDQVTCRSLTWLLLVAVAGLSAFVFACGGGADDPDGGTSSSNTTAAQGDELPTVEMPSLWAWGDAEHLDTLVGSADVVFSGTVVALKGQRPAMSQPGEGEPGPAAPRWADFPVSQFEVQVESVVSGTLTQATSVIFEQTGGIETRPDGTRVRLMLEGDPPIRVGQKYLFFGTLGAGGNIEAPPFGRMQVRPDGSLMAEAGWGDVGALAELSRKKLGDAEQQIRVAARD